jgi:hypothetical protein
VFSPECWDQRARRSHTSRRSTATALTGARPRKQTRADFEKWPDAFVCIPTGIENGIFVVEADTPKGHDVDGIASLKELEAAHSPLPATLQAISPSGSVHNYFKHPGVGIKIKQSTSEIAPGVDVRGDGGMVVAPPSYNPKYKGVYRWRNELPIAEAPPWLLDLVIEKKAERATTRTKQQADNPEDIAKALAVLPNADLGWEEWNRHAMATWGATGGSEEGFAAFDAWSQKSGKYNAETTRDRWDEITECPPNTIGAGTIFHMAADEHEHIVKDLNEIYALVIVGDKVVVMKTCGETISFLTVSAFELWYSNKFVTLRNDKKMPVGQYWIKSRHRRQYEGLVFSPDRDVPGYFNLWRGFAVKPLPGDCSKFLAHIRDNVCSGNDDLYKWVIGWFADIVQHPDKKIGTSLALRGKQGTGKTIVGKIFGSLLGPHYVPVSDPRMITGRFNAHLTSCLLLHADEGFWAGDRAAEGKLKDLITGDYHHIEFKGKELIRVRNYTRMLITGNQDWLMPAGLEERRPAVIDIGEGNIQDHKYFAAIENEADNGGREALLYHLLNFNLKSVDLRTIPATAALLDQKIFSMNSELKWWMDVLISGELPWGCDEVGQCPTKVLFDSYIYHARKQGVARRAIEVQIGKFLTKHVPGLRKLERRIFKVIYKGETAGSREGRIYEFPPLAECRKAFAEKLKQEIEWDDQNAWTTTEVEIGEFSTD